MPQTFEIEIRVRYNETDAQGHVHHSTYFNYFELGYGAALSVILFVIIGLLTTLAFKTARGWVFYSGGQ